MWDVIIAYVMKFIHWAWKNKFTMLFLVTTIVAMIMYGCEKMEVSSLEKKLDKTKKEMVVCEEQYKLCNANFTAIAKTNEQMKAMKDICENELKIVRESYKLAKEVEDRFNEEIKKYKDLAKALDDEKDPQKQFEMKKKLLEQLFKGKKMYQLKPLNIR